MKTTSYIIFGLLGAGAICAFGGGALVGLLSQRISQKMLTSVEGIKESRPLEAFSVINVETLQYCDSLIVNFEEDPQINVIEDSLADSPRIEMNADWDKYLTLRQTGDSLSIVLDFHGLIEGKKFSSGSDKLIRNVHVFNPKDLSIYVPSGMLKSVSPDRNSYFSFEGITADSLSIDRLTDMAFNSCRIGTLAFSGEANRVGGRSYYYRRSDLKLYGSTVGLMNLRVPATEINLSGSESHINMLEWFDTSLYGNQTARITALNGMVGDVEWSSPKESNKLFYTIKFTSGKSYEAEEE